MIVWQRGESKEVPVLSAKEEEQEEQRAAMRMALARRMKQSLVESEEARLSEQYDTQYSALDSKLLEVERLRAENQMREGILAENLRRQQAAIARNVQRSGPAFVLAVMRNMAFALLWPAVHMDVLCCAVLHGNVLMCGVYSAGLRRSYDRKRTRFAEHCVLSCLCSAVT